jgi:hypothetical protein
VDVDEFEARQLSHKGFIVILLILTIFSLDKVDGQQFESEVDSADGCIQQKTLQ